MAFPIAAVAGAGASLLSTGINAFTQGAQNRANQQHAEHLYKMQRDDSIKMWELQNQYNSPEQQMQRLQQAGLNPNMVYGNGSAANTASPVNIPHASTVPGRAPQIDLAAPVDGYFNALTKQATLSNMAKQADLLDAELRLKNAEVVNKLFRNDVNSSVPFDVHTESIIRRFNNMGLDTKIKDSSLNLMEQRLKQMVATGLAIDLDNQNRVKRGEQLNLQNIGQRIKNKSDSNVLETQMGGITRENILKLLIQGISTFKR